MNIRLGGRESWKVIHLLEQELHKYRNSASALILQLVRGYDLSVLSQTQM